MYAAQNGHTACIKLLAAKGADVNLQSSHWGAVLDLALIVGGVKFWKKVAEKPAELAEVEHEGEDSDLVKPAESERKRSSIRVRRHSSFTERRVPRNGKTPLMLAGLNGKTECLTTLLELGANVNDANSMGKTALMCAAANGHIQCVKELILAGAKVDQVDCEGANAVDYAHNGGHLDIKDWLAGNRKRSVDHMLAVSDATINMARVGEASLN